MMKPDFFTSPLILIDFSKISKFLVLDFIVFYNEILKNFFFCCEIDQWFYKGILNNSLTFQWESIDFIVIYNKILTKKTYLSHFLHFSYFSHLFRRLGWRLEAAASQASGKSVKSLKSVKSAKSVFFWWRAETAFIQSPVAHLRTTDKIQILYFIVLWGPGSHSMKVSVWLWHNKYLWIMLLLPCSNVFVWWAYKAHVSVFSFFMNR